MRLRHLRNMFETAVSTATVVVGRHRHCINARTVEHRLKEHEFFAVDLIKVKY